MKILHTSDWHAGRAWKSVDRLPELAAVLDRLAGFVEREKVDLLLVSGDVFDGGAPPPDAERVVFAFFKRVGLAGTHSVVIAGNHDSAARLEAWGALAELVRVHAVGRPRPPDRGGVVEITSRAGEKAVVAALPFAPIGHLVSALELADEAEAMKRYADGVREMIRRLAARFRPDAVNLLVAHTHLEGAAYSGTERRVHLGEDWAATPQALPHEAHYVALGHIHRPQAVEAAPAPTRYAGSPLQLDFGEAGEAKSFVLVEARPKAGPARVGCVPYEGGKPLRDVRATLVELERDAEALREGGWLRVTVPLDRPDPDIAAKVRRLLPNALVIRPDAPRADAEKEPPHEVRGLAPREAFAAYFRGAHGREAEPELLDAFEALRERCAKEA